MWSWPAERTDGGYFTSGITPIPEGTRFRLDPNLNIASLHLPTLDREIAQAAQTYGIVVRDKAGAVSFYGQDPKSIGTNPWPQALDNDYPNTYLSWFPGATSRLSRRRRPVAGAPKRRRAQRLVDVVQRRNVRAVRGGSYRSRRASAAARDIE